MLEIFKTVAALGGLISAAFVIWEKHFRFFPSAYIVSKPLMEGSRNLFPYLRIHNRSERPLILTWRDKDKTSDFRIAIDQSTRGVVQALVEGETSVVLDGLETKDYPLYNPDGLDEAANETEIRASLDWRFAQPRFWTWRRSIAVKIDKRSLLILTDQME